MNLEDAIEIFRLSDVGLLRDHNEDAVASDIEVGLLVLADGMGGYKAGEVASEIAVLTILAELKEAMLGLRPGQMDALFGMEVESQLIRDAVDIANESIYTISQVVPHCEGMGTTLVLGLFTDNKFLVGHIGDSRAYRLRKSELRRITEDHSLLQEQLNLGLITPEEARFSNNKNLVTRALGVDPTVELELHEHEVEVGDLYLLCSDGLTDVAEDEEIQAILEGYGGNLEAAATQLVELANAYGGKDNISVILARVNEPFTANHSWHYNLLNWLR